MPGLDTIRDQISNTPEFDKSCLTSLSSKFILGCLFLKFQLTCAFGTFNPNFFNLVTEDLHQRSFKAIKAKRGHQSKSSSKVLKDITNQAHLRNKKRIAPSPSLNELSQNSDEDDELVGTDLFGGSHSFFFFETQPFLLLLYL